MSTIPSKLSYTKDHEWLRLLDDGSALVGITDYAQESLGDITFVECPDVGTSFQQGEIFGVVESVKAASDLYIPATGEIVEINAKLEAEPEAVNEDPYGEGWMVRIRPEDPSEVDNLLDAASYAALI